MSTTDVELVASPMGGGWAIARTPKGSTICSRIFGGAAVQLPIGETGWLLEPSEAVDLVARMADADLVVQTASGLILPHKSATRH